MAFAKINIPTFDVVVPSTNKSIKCRPYLVGENKILLSALESNNPKETTEAVKHIINNCVVDWKGQSLEELAIFDLELIFLKIRAKAKGETIKVRFNPIENAECEECKKAKVISIDLDKLEIHRNPEHTDKIKLTNELTLQMTYPKYQFIGDLVQKDSTKTSEIEVLFDLIKSCMVNVFDKDSVFEVKDATDKEITEFLERLDDKQFQKILEFFATMPRIEYTVDLSCEKCGRKDVQTITGLQSFFE